MSYYPDLSIYEYRSSFYETVHSKTGLTVLNIGWLDNNYDFTKGNMPEELLEILLKLSVNCVNTMRGFHVCNICPNLPNAALTVIFEGEERGIGHGEIWLKGESDVVYAAPNLIYHYVKDHNYLPPKEFLNALEKCETIEPERIVHPEITKYFDDLKDVSKGKNVKLLEKLSDRKIKKSPLSSIIKFFSK